jgi:hypothetical protein
MIPVPYCKADDTGRIIEYGSLSPYTFLYRIDPAYVYDPVGVTPETHYVSDGMVRERPRMELQRHGQQLSGLPDPCTVTINNQPYTVTGSQVDLDFPQPGQYQVVLSAWPWQEVALEITISEPDNNETDPS